jgi:hypothetical protein
MESLYVLSTGLTKISILLFFRRLGKGTMSRGFLWAMYIALFSVVAYMVAFLFDLFLSCRPLNANWNRVDLAWLGEHYGKFSCVSEFA